MWSGAPWVTRIRSTSMTSSMVMGHSVFFVMQGSINIFVPFPVVNSKNEIPRYLKVTVNFFLPPILTDGSKVGFWVLKASGLASSKKREHLERTLNPVRYRSITVLRERVVN